MLPDSYTEYGRPPLCIPEVEYVCFTDDRVCDMASGTAVTSHFDPCRSAKRFKVLPHLFVDAERSIWIDANCRLLCDPRDLGRV